MPFAIRKLHLSLYRCTASGNPSVQFANSMPFFCTLHHDMKNCLKWMTPAGSVSPFCILFSSPYIIYHYNMQDGIFKIPSFCLQKLKNHSPKIARNPLVSTVLRCLKIFLKNFKKTIDIFEKEWYTSLAVSEEQQMNLEN